MRVSKVNGKYQYRGDLDVEESQKEAIELREEVVKLLNKFVSTKQYKDPPYQPIKKELLELFEKQILFEDLFYAGSAQLCFSEIVRYGKILKSTENHLVSLKHITEKVLNENYPSDLETYQDLDDREKEQLKVNSNADKLSLAMDWLFEMIEDIVRICEEDDANHEKILNRIREDFPDFTSIPNEPDVCFIKGMGNVNKTAVDKALTYIFNETYETDIKPGTITRRFDEYGIW